MLTRSIRFKNFSGKKNKLLNKKLINIFKSENWLTKYPLLNSLNKNYNYSYKNKNISRLKKYNNFNLIGMGGSILGTEAIYDFLSFKVKKNFNFYNNLQGKDILTSKKNRVS